jgi:hypothetical protein
VDTARLVTRLFAVEAESGGARSALTMTLTLTLSLSGQMVAAQQQLLRSGAVHSDLTQSLPSHVPLELLDVVFVEKSIL